MSDIQEEQKKLYKRAEENDIKLLKEEIKEILNRLEIVARKHTIEVCENGSKIETLPASVVDELRLNNYSAKILLDYITNLQEENEHLDKVNCQLRKRINNDIYKSRNEKAIEYINNCPEYLWANVNTKSLLDILQGVDKE